MADNDEFRIMGFRELEEYAKKEGVYHEQDPRNPMNRYDTDTPEEAKARAEKILQERKEIDAKEDTKGELEALPMPRGNKVKKIIDKDIKKGVKVKAAKGGSIAKQMEMFEEGGLKQEGGSVDPVSGNDVPIGSTKEEVRDDIPAQLSEGEFVMPADVVRFHGLDKMMQLRDEAKAGLRKMEAMGQMGNSEEATLPDDVPFNMDDLDVDDNENEPLEMAQGGVVQAANGTFMTPSTGIGGYQQSQFVNYTPQFTPFQPTQLPTTGYVAPQQQQVPLASQQTLPQFQDVIPAPEGKYDEIIEYENEEGLKLSIPFVNGKPIYPIPKGYKKVETGIVKPEDVATTTAQPKPITTTGDGGSGISPAEAKAQADRMAQVSAKTTRAKELGYTPANPITSVLGALTPLGMLGVGKTPGTIDMAGNVIGQDKRSYDPITGKAVSTGNIFSDIMNAVTGKDMSNLTPVTDPTTGQTSMVEIGKGAQALGVTPMTAGGMKQYTPAELMSQITQAQKELDVAKATVSRAQADVGQTGGAFEVPAYDTVADFGKAMAASAATGFYGSYATAKAIATDPTKTAKQKEKAINFGRRMNPFFDMDIDTRSDAEVEADLETISQEAAQDPQTQAEMGFTDMSAFGGSEADTGTGVDGTGMGGGGEDPSGPDSDSGQEDAIYKGYLITKRKASGKLKKKYMKRGGLASKK